MLTRIGAGTTILRRQNLAPRRAHDIVSRRSACRVGIPRPAPGDPVLTAPSSFELEIKLALPDEAAWRAVRALLRSPAAVLQANHFFDTRDRVLDRALIGVRLREAGESTRLTVKSASAAERERDGATEDMLTQRVEIDESISRQDFDQALRDGLELAPWLDTWRARPSGRDPRVAAVIDTLTPIGRLETFGAFTNERTIGHLDLDTLEDPLEVELDRTTFPGARVDYELEVELDAETAPADAQRIRNAVFDRLAALGIRPTAAPSKLARFRDALDRGGR